MMADAFSFLWIENHGYDKQTLFTIMKEGVLPVRFLSTMPKDWHTVIIFCAY